MLQKRLLSLVPLLAVAAAVLGTGASAAMGAECKEEAGKPSHVLCPNGEPTGKLRDDFTEPPEGVSGGSFGASIFAVNTLGALRLTAPTGAFSENPAGYGFFGVKLHSDPVTATACKEGAGEAEGWVTFVDIQNAKTSVPEAAPVYDDTSPGDNGPWPIGIRSNHCTSRPGKVVIERTAFFFPGLANAVITGNLVGNYSQPNAAKCPGGGISLEETQTVSINGKSGETVKITAGAAGLAFICFVSSNNILFPNPAPTWTLTGSIWKD